MEARLEIEGLGARAGGRAVLDGVSFSVARGETLAIVGPNGAGKTTLLECVVGLRRYEGRVRYAGEVLRSLPQRARVLSYMPDELRLPEEISVRSALLIDAANPCIDALDVRAFLPAKGHQLSRGECKRVQLAAALGMQREVLVLDEPFAALDPRQLRDLLPAFRTATRARATLVTVHQMRTAELVADRVLLLSAGRVVAVGTPAELRAQTGLPEGAFDDVFLALLVRDPA
jgi:ABC-2 type transport system ATP-binding protein